MPSATESKVLVLLVEEGSPAELRRALAARPDRPEVQIAASAQVGLLDWYATDEDEAYARAAERARAVEAEVSGKAEPRGGRAGDPDPVMAVADALESSPAEEIVVVGRGNGALETSLRRFGMSVTRLGGHVEPERGDELRETSRAVMSGRSRATPLVFILTANLALLAVALLLLLVNLLILWLA